MKIPYTKDYVDDVLIRFAYHSTGIEGNTLSLADTTSILMYGKVVGSRPYSLREIYEIDNHKQAFAYMFESAEREAPFSPSLIRAFHSLLTEKIQSDCGQYKTTPNLIVGATFQTAQPFEVPMKIQDWCIELNEKLEQAETDTEQLKALLECHIAFERIHPFSDGNGRVGRILLNYGLVKYQRPLLVIEREDKAEYVHFLSTENAQQFLDFSQKKLKEEHSRLNSFYQVEKRKLVD